MLFLLVACASRGGQREINNVIVSLQSISVNYVRPAERDSGLPDAEKQYYQTDSLYGLLCPYFH
jgi:hypothetical protein